MYLRYKKERKTKMAEKKLVVQAFRGDVELDFAELPITGIYDDHIQFAGKFLKEHLCIRVMFDDIPSLVDELLQQLRKVTVREQNRN